MNRQTATFLFHLPDHFYSMIRLILVFSFLFSAHILPAQTPDIPTILELNKQTLGVSDKDLSEYTLSSAYTTAHLGVTHIYLEQAYQGIRVHHGMLNLNVKGSQLLSFGNRWIAGLSELAPSNLPDITALTAIERSASHLDQNFSNPTLKDTISNRLGQITKLIFDHSTLSREDIVVELVWLSEESKDVQLCWSVTIFETNAENVWLVFIDAHSGAFVKKENLVRHCDFGTPEYMSGPAQNHNQQKTSFETYFPPPQADSCYRVFATPVESPNHGPRSLVVRPWLNAGASNDAITLGWHRDGTTSYTKTRGNNVYAYDDIDNNNLPGFSPDTSNFQFDYPFVPTLPPVQNLKACVTNLFYWNNIMHDVMYQYGFNEVSGNFQNSNLGRGGLGSDYVLAEAQDGGGTNNANFYTPVDGSKGRMQMYLWSPVPLTSPLTINSPASIAGSMYAVESGFSTANKLANIGLTTGNLILVQDSGGPTHLACGALSNAGSIPGKIAVIDRGSCDFVTKVKNVQNLGAIAAIVVNNVPGAPFVMGGTDNSIVIPAVMISLEDGNTLKAVLDTSNVNASLDAVPLITPDGDYDSGIVAHEYGHGNYIRLTGGPSNVSCLNNAEQMGEGWSDFFGLMLTTDWTTAEPTDKRGIGTYALGQPTNGVGIRTYPYSTDTLLNPFTYADIANAPLSGGSPSPHYVGSVWCTMLWEMTWEIIAMEGVDTNLYAGDGGNNVALQLVIDGLKLQPCSPGFVDGRDAILLADQLNYGGIHQCAIWNAFARRGLGYGANQGSSASHTDGTESYNIPDGVTIKSTPSVSLGTEGQDVTFNLKTICGCTPKSDLDIKDVLSQNITYIPGSGGAINGNTVVFSADTLAPLDSLLFSYHAFINPCSPTDSLILSEEHAESPDQYVTIKLAGSGTKRWVKSTAQYVSPANSWYAQDYTSLGDFVLKLINPVTTSGVVEISFKHRYQTEAQYDGGVVEYSINGGTTWLDAGAFFVEHGYPDAISSTNTDSPLAGRDAFTGNSDTQFNANGFIRSRIKLSTAPGQSLLIRFRFACDGGVGGSGINGWYIDDIYIRQLSSISNKTVVVVENMPVDSQYYALQTAYFTGKTVYVDQSAGGSRNGTSWSNAMQYLPMALGVASCRPIDSIFVATGSYLPTLTTNRLIAFNIPNNRSVYGGFPTGGSSFAMRNPSTNITTLSGDIGVANNISDNVYHILKVAPGQLGVILDGFTLSKGNANGTGDDSKGSAVFCEGALTLKNITMSLNSGADHGQIIYNRGSTSNLKLENCIIHSPSDGWYKIVNTNTAQINIQSNTQILKD